MKVLAVAGARPNFMKIAPLMRTMQDRPEIDAHLVHTGQHYDRAMSQLFFEELRIPRPDVDLAVGSGSHAVQTAEVMKRFEPVLVEEAPDVVLVVGDVNSTLACTLVAVKLGVPVAHVEAGLRSFDRTMPEEVNRVLTDAVAEFLFVSEPSGVENLRREGIPAERVFFVGNVMIDTLLRHRRRSEHSDILERLRLHSRHYAVLTLHRPANVDDPDLLERLLETLDRIGRELPVVFPIHPRTRASFPGVEHFEHLRVIEPLGYLDFLKLMGHARLVLTDSGGIQEETTALGVPCLTLRNNTERPATIEQGTNRLVGSDPEEVWKAAREVLHGRPQPFRIPELWDGRAAERVVDVLEQALSRSGQTELVAA
jgi:UDP-N-acetylglucosamine 2-epimerase (non-hydrolysing)